MTKKKPIKKKKIEGKLRRYRGWAIVTTFDTIVGASSVNRNVLEQRLEESGNWRCWRIVQAVISIRE